MMKPKCPTCRTVRATDEMRKHPSFTSVAAVQIKLDEARKYEHIANCCPDHADPQVRRGIYQMVELWMYREEDKLVLDDYRPIGRPVHAS